MKFLSLIHILSSVTFSADASGIVCRLFGRGCGGGGSTAPPPSPPPPSPTPPSPSTSPPTPLPVRPPSSLYSWANASSCMSGGTGLIKVNDVAASGNDVDNKHLRHQNPNQVTKLKDLKIGDKILGFDDKIQPSTCTVEAIGQFGFGMLYGNYTDDHFIFNPSTGMVQEHGTLPNNLITEQDKYEILTDCPLGVDEVGTKFTPIDSDFCGSHLKELSWSDYVLLHKGILRIVRATGGFWFSMTTYPKFELVQEHSPSLCANMLKCMKDHEDCEDFEESSIFFIENLISEPAKMISKGAFYNIGRHRELGSVTASVSAGKSVRG